MPPPRLLEKAVSSCEIAETIRHHRWSRRLVRQTPTATCYLRILTALAMTNAIVNSATADWSNMSILAHLDIGMVSVGLKAVTFVNET